MEGSKFGSGRGLRLQLLAVLALSLSPLLVLSITQGVVEFQEERRARLDHLYTIGTRATDDIHAVFERAAGVVSAIAAQPDRLTTREAGCDDALRAVTAARPIYSELASINADGHIVCSANARRETRTISGMPWFERLRNGAEEAFSGVSLEPGLERPTITVGHVLLDQGEFTGAIALSIDVRAALQLLHSENLPESFSLALVDGDGRLSYMRDGEDGLRLEALPEDQLRRVRENNEPAFVEAISDIPDKSLLIIPLVGRDIQLALIAPTLSLDSWQGFDIVGTVLVPSLMWLLALLCVGLAIDFFVLRWLSYLQRFARLYGAGRLELVPLRAHRAPSEVRELADTMSSMAAALDERTDELETVAEQRGALLKEIHHRVKNNLQVIISLLNIQAGRLQDTQARAVLTEARGRINALALVHRTLYEADDLRVVDMKPFLETLVTQLEAASRHGEVDVAVTTEAVSVELDPDLAIPAALFVTEAITNAYKHAFNAKSDDARLVVRLYRQSPDTIALEVEDNGHGLGENMKSGTGSSLMDAFARQLEGEAVRETNEMGGVTIRLEFPG
ncbi:sensor histidine kinase [Maricaulis sp. CAU 1757]